MTRITNREAALKELLLRIFNTEELRLHLATECEGSGLVATLPEVGVSQAKLVSEAVGALFRWGFIDRDFFNNLEAIRSKRIREIRHVRALWLDNAKLDHGERWAEGRYELVSPIGRGGFGLVWKAIDTRSGAFVALKILLEHHADDRRVRQRFFRGAEVLAKLSHTGIVGVRSDVEQEGLRFYYVMDFINGESLNSLISNRPRAQLLEHVLQIGDALGHIHARDLLHRDIKPDNILINSNGQAKLIDFDLVTGDAYNSMTTQAVGTALYSPPEARASDKKTAAYDIFSLARTFEYVLRRREPTAQELAVDSVAMLDTSEAVKATLRAALRLDPAERTQSVERFCADLRVALGTVGTPGPLIVASPTNTSGPSPLIPPILEVAPLSDPTSLAGAFSTGSATTARIGMALAPEAPVPAPISGSLGISEQKLRRVLALMRDHAPIDVLPLSGRALDALSGAGLTLAIEILDLPDTRLRAIRGVNSTVAREIAVLRGRCLPLQTAPAAAPFFPHYRGIDLTVDAAGLPTGVTQTLKDAGFRDISVVAATSATQLETLARRHGFALAVLRSRLQALHDSADSSEQALQPPPRPPPQFITIAESALSRQLASASLFIARVPEEHRAQILRAVHCLVCYGEPVPESTFAAAMQIAARNVSGLVSYLGEDLNTDGEAVIQYDWIERRVILNVESLREGFELKG